MSRCLIVVGYNNVRIYDIAKLRAICKSHHNAKLVLITEHAQAQDYSTADVVISTSLGKDMLEGSLKCVLDTLKQLDFELIGVLPFSDRGVLLGAALTTYFGLPGVSPEDAMAGLDKRVFRQLDQAASPYPDGYKPVFSVQVESLDALISVVNRLGGHAFVKPANEGNSRGCQVICHPDECAKAWELLAPYQGGGVIVEELIENAQEYSWDYVAGHVWITEKHTTEDEFRAEMQQIVPARLPERIARRIDAAGDYMRRLVSVDNGAYHNEIFCNADMTAAVETNMRPAGMHIWDLAKDSFADFNPWEVWVNWSVTGEWNKVPLNLVRYSGIRMIRAPKDGTLLAVPDIVELGRAMGIHVENASYSKRIGDRVTAKVTDNSLFVGEIMLHDSSYDSLTDKLKRLAAEVEAQLQIAAEILSEPIHSNA
ncbi:ATP-grasp domain-containing protein [Paludibacterium yongneupense]|uniref:ATP-grasp domain-containing protein n=1 Tax=Paludibacterium yongneupense TaxID=400061 RepID=UPI0003FC61EA|nr:hypothetical protein [Paludibacterium yongneupense]